MSLLHFIFISRLVFLTSLNCLCFLSLHYGIYSYLVRIHWTYFNGYFEFIFLYVVWLFSGTLMWEYTTNIWKRHIFLDFHFICVLLVRFGHLIRLLIVPFNVDVCPTLLNRCYLLLLQLGRFWISWVVHGLQSWYHSVVIVKRVLKVLLTQQGQGVPSITQTNPLWSYQIFVAVSKKLRLVYYSEMKSHTYQRSTEMLSTGLQLKCYSSSGTERGNLPQSVPGPLVNILNWCHVKQDHC